MQGENKDERKDLSKRIPDKLPVAIDFLKQVANSASRQSNFDEFLDLYKAFVTKHGELPSNIIRESDLVERADSISGLEVRLGELLNQNQFYKSRPGDEDGYKNAFEFRTRTYLTIRRKYRDDYWKYQCMLILAKKAASCRIEKAFPEDLEKFNFGSRV